MACIACWGAMLAGTAFCCWVGLHTAIDTGKEPRGLQVPPCQLCKASAILWPSAALSSSLRHSPGHLVAYPKLPPAFPAQRSPPPPPLPPRCGRRPCLPPWAPAPAPLWCWEAPQPSSAEWRCLWPSASCGRDGCAACLASRLVLAVHLCPPLLSAAMDCPPVPCRNLRQRPVRSAAAAASSPAKSAWVSRTRAGQQPLPAVELAPMRRVLRAHARLPCFLPFTVGRGMLRCRAPVRQSQLARKLRPQAAGSASGAAAPTLQCICPACGASREQRCLNCLGEGRVCLPA